MSKRSRCTEEENIIIEGGDESYLEWQCRFIVGIMPEVSAQYRLAIYGCLERIARTLDSYQLADIREIERDHISRLFVELSSKGLSGNYLALYASALRRLLGVMDKEWLVPDNKTLFGGRHRGRP